MTRLVEVDLDSAEGLERLWAELNHHRTIRALDPPLRAAILKRCRRYSGGEPLDPILRDLDELHPAVVLETWFTTLVPDKPTIGAVRRGTTQ